MTESILTVCITHKAPIICNSFYDLVIGLGDHDKTSRYHISALDPFWHNARPVAYSAAGSYAIEDALRIAKAEPQIVGIVSQRKFLCRQPIGRSAPYYPALREVDPVEMSQLDDRLTRPAADIPFLITRPVFLAQGVFLNYLKCHHIVDLIDYLSLAARMRILDNSEIEHLIKRTDIIPGGCECGYYPTHWLFSILRTLRSLGHAFIEQYGNRVATYSPQQVRALSFLSERLGSYLLFQKLASLYGSAIDPRVFGHMCVVVEGSHYTHAVA